MPEPELPRIDGTYNFVITGVGGTGVVTIGAILAMAAHVDGKGAGMMEMAGLAQKGGAVNIHCRIAEKPSDITAIRVAIGEADAIIGGDLVVSASGATLGLMKKGRTQAVVNSHEIITGEFTRNAEFSLPNERLTLALQARLGEDSVGFCDFTALSRQLLGDSIYSNMMIFGAAWQRGMVPLTHAAIFDAIELNGAGVAGNKRAFDLGRWTIEHPRDAMAELGKSPDAAAPTAQEQIELRVAHLTAYQSKRYARRYLKRVNAAPENLKLSIAKGYHKLLTYKDEYEVARLHVDGILAQTAREFDGNLRLRFHLAPPLLSRKGPDGRPVKREFGPWILKVFGVLARLKKLRGTPLDVFARSDERKMERRLIEEYEADMDEILAGLNDGNGSLAVKIAELPLEIRGFGPVKQASVEKYAKKRERLLAKFRAGGTPQKIAAQ